MSSCTMLDNKLGTVVTKAKNNTNNAASIINRKFY